MTKRVGDPDRALRDLNITAAPTPPGSFDEYRVPVIAQPFPVIGCAQLTPTYGKEINDLVKVESLE